MSRVKELLDEINQSKPDWVYDLEYLEWAEWSNRPHVNNKDKDESK